MSNAALVPLIQGGAFIAGYGNPDRSLADSGGKPFSVRAAMLPVCPPRANAGESRATTGNFGVTHKTCG